MCGFAGYIVRDHRQRIEQTVLQSMTRRLIHRGPDSEGYFADDFCALGFRRLKILDLVTGEQPLYNEDRSIVAVCNGEIFNYRKLRTELVDRGHIFRSTGDCEVLVHLYEEYGQDLLAKLNGQFGFVIYDRKEQSLFIARDHFGVIPVFYTEFAGGLAFASEIKALLEHPLVSPRVDLIGLDQVLSFPGLVSPRTMFQGIHSVESGHCLSFTNNRLHKLKYWDIDYPCEGEIAAKSEDYYRDHLRELLACSVRKRLQADVPVGVYLSGGLDSSLIAVVARQLAQTPLSSFSMRFAERDIDESKYQQLVAMAQHRSCLFEHRQIVQFLPQMIFHCECAVKETYNVCSLLLAELARENGVRVILSGEGADELFAGYVGYRFDNFGHQQRHRDALSEALECELREKLWGDAGLFYEKQQYAFRETKQFLYSKAVYECFPQFDCSHFPVVDTEQLRGRHPLHQRSYLDFKLRLADHLLGDHGDRMAMSQSVEIRYPFLDLDVVRFATQIPTNFKLHQYDEKYMLKQVAREILPQAIVSRKKFGFRAPGTPYLLQTKDEWLQDMLSYERIRRQGYWNPDSVERLKTAYSRPGFQLGVPFEDDLLMIVLSFNILLEQFDLAEF